MKKKAELHKDNLSCMMITYPSTHGVYEEKVKEGIDVIHKYGGQVYMDGANMNAQMGLTGPGFIGADIGHLNLHETIRNPPRRRRSRHRPRRLQEAPEALLCQATQ